ncbi:GNAT family N-acetyltransferase [Kaistella palustris]|uniref:GNAT family N-acetyltransferase n=1 Tax=Kaistella palustris TaxID=493376 RepID=UPI0003F4DD91|nr:GNAT family N-acetyltransferase [Kaistella palustris]
MNYEIRPMLSSDIKRVIEIFEEGIAGGNATFDPRAPSADEWEQKYVKSCRWVLEDETDEIVGWAALQPVSNRECFRGVAEVSIYLTADVQGKGLGAMLLKKLITDSEEQNFWTLQAGIFPENQASISVHKKLGFRLVGNREKIGQMNGRWRDIAFLERRSKTVGL